MPRKNGMCKVGNMKKYNVTALGEILIDFTFVGYSEGNMRLFEQMQLLQLMQQRYHNRLLNLTIFYMFHFLELILKLAYNLKHYQIQLGMQRQLLRILIIAMKQLLFVE